MVKKIILVKMALFWTGCWHSRDQNGPKWSILVHFGLKELYFGPFRSTNRTLATPEIIIGDYRAISVHSGLHLCLPGHKLPWLQVAGAFLLLVVLSVCLRYARAVTFPSCCANTPNQQKTLQTCQTCNGLQEFIWQQSTLETMIVSWPPSNRTRIPPKNNQINQK